ncbi:hypothetical protein DSL72_008392 [Monilinia vaccinii-corymbosi]|uniref:Uncharacterized protein n=1 Tax=Monilinia vaccinii-corymbosi TaxID=61207 RepID=A0A8A3PJL3_9HELO|nr:hypothetical protein DSL72_008392 [Monilinia vaccinii-corymbosi]
MPTAAKPENNNLVLTALFKQIDMGRTGIINFKRLAEDIPVNGENAARHRWTRVLESLGIREKMGKSKDDGKESEGVESVLREGSEVESPMKGVKRKMEDEEFIDEEQQ